MPQSLVVRDARKVKAIKDELTFSELFDKERKIVKTANGYEIPLVDQKADGSSYSPADGSDHIDKQRVLTTAHGYKIPLVHQEGDVPGLFQDTFVTESSVAIPKPTPTSLQSALQLWNIDSNQFPSRWSVYPPMVLFPSGSHRQLEAMDPPKELYEYLLSRGLFGRKDQTHIAVNAPLDENDIVRRPHIIPVFGDFGQFLSDPPTNQDFSTAFWVSSIQNGIYQTWCPLYTMFSRGNITEKARVLNEFAGQAPIKDQVIVDMYAGIGYFTFSYAAQGPRRIFCWEINPWSVEALIRGAKKNGFPVKLVKENEAYLEQDSDMIVVFFENNQNALNRLRSLQIMERLTHINLGLLPDSKQAFESATNMALRSQQTILHIHENVKVDYLDCWLKNTKISLQTIMSSPDPNWSHGTEHSIESIHLEKIKTFAPDVYHVCGDFRVTS
jgi:tRNA wybutosine-synthesizing protein 2